MPIFWYEVDSFMCMMGKLWFIMIKMIFCYGSWLWVYFLSSLIQKLTIGASESSSNTPIILLLKVKHWQWKTKHKYKVITSHIK